MVGEWPVPQGAGRDAIRFELSAPVLVTTGFLRLELIGAGKSGSPRPRHFFSPMLYALSRSY